MAWVTSRRGGDGCAPWGGGVVRQQRRRPAVVDVADPVPPWLDPSVLPSNHHAKPPARANSGEGTRGQEEARKKRDEAGGVLVFACGNGGPEVLERRRRTTLRQWETARSSSRSPPWVSTTLTHSSATAAPAGAAPGSCDELRFRFCCCVICFVCRAAVALQVCSLLAGGGYAKKVVVPVPVPVLRESPLRMPAGLTTSSRRTVSCKNNLLFPRQVENSIHGGSSGIRTFAIQTAKRLGIKVFNHSRMQTEIKISMYQRWIHANGHQYTVIDCLFPLLVLGHAGLATLASHCGPVCATAGLPTLASHCGPVCAAAGSTFAPRCCMVHSLSSWLW